MGSKCSKRSRLTSTDEERLALQKYYGARAPLQHTPGIDKVLKQWIRNELAIGIARDLFFLILSYLSHFDKFAFQMNYLWETRQIKSIQDTIYQTAYKKQGGATYHNILFGAILTGDIEFECTVIFSSYSGNQPQWNLTQFDDKRIGTDEHDTKYKDRLSVGLVEPDFHDYLEQTMHLKSKHKRCVFRKDAYFDCNGVRHAYDDENFDALCGRIRFDMCVNMKEHTFCITDSEERSQIIADIPDHRVICFEVWDCKSYRSIF